MGQFQNHQQFDIVIHLAFFLCYAVLLDKNFYFSVATENETSILSAINMQKKKLTPLGGGHDGPKNVFDHCA